ncbi:MAG: SHOCT domain-containing protein [Lutibacter sp.]
MMIFWFGFSIAVLIVILIFKEKIEPDNNIDSLDILDKKYTNGEITKDEYLEQKESLNL